MIHIRRPAGAPDIDHTMICGNDQGNCRIIDRPEQLRDTDCSALHCCQQYACQKQQRQYSVIVIDITQYNDHTDARTHRDTLAEIAEHMLHQRSGKSAMLQDQKREQEHDHHDQITDNPFVGIQCPRKMPEYRITPCRQKQKMHCHSKQR